ncbi:aliphatic sulfonate ABC transporter substrate-binding protein [Sphingomonas histidinilytica]|uniref:Putative aliphatic sulfonates-binding protein n=1 Tax=Rhizorhabdus histidinilytica TaxID=439228 RepID=A0A1T5FHN4_9SPHN|nr:ABC transporter substrate-binding protein [Rhizorhabdus histidinilytica]MBO9375617.1 aliphatic sulfonate ABC transporter substrate-binding protein [Rhizorhabdus histidinilytica]SKB95596.1 sulfonate transport system substrate-binding protein [Rhizorhabdus histidinilytica]
MKRVGKAFFGALAALLALTACGRDAGGDTTVLHVGSQRGGTRAVLLASGALEGAPYTVEWSEFPAAQHLLEAIGGGAVDVGVVGDAPFIFAYQSGSRIKAVGAQFVEERPVGALALIVPKASAARSIADLKGRKIATTRGSVGHYLVIRALQQAKLPPDWVNFVFLSPGDAKAAFSSGAIDGWATWAPYLLPAFKEGARTIVDGHDLVKGYGFDVANEAAIRAKPAILADFLKREAKALAWARANPGPYGVVLARETGLPIEIARDYAIKNGRTLVPIDDALIEEQRQVLDDFHAAGAVRGDRALADGFDRSLFSEKVAN